MDERILRLKEVMEILGITKYNLANASGLSPSNLSYMLNGKQSITDRTLHKIANAFPQINLEWLKTGEGEPLNDNPAMIQNGGSGVRQQGFAGHDLTQTNNSEKLLSDFLIGIQSHNDILNKSMSQTDKAMSQTDRAMDQMDKALDEIGEQRKMIEKAMNQTDTLISIIQNNLQK